MASARLNWLPDETVYSLCSRWHAISGHSVAHQTTRAIFQHDRHGSAHDLPPRLNYFASRFDYKLGSPKEIALKHTILPFFFPFLSESRREKALQVMCGEEKAHLKYHLGLLTSNQGALHPLKFCSDCVNEDIDNYGTSYWHLIHQLPGSALCLQHSKPLIIAKEKTFGYRRFHWVLPSDAQRNPSTELFTAATSQWIGFQECLQDFYASATSGDCYTHQRFADISLRQLRNNGFGSIQRTASLDWGRASKDLLSGLNPLLQSPYIDMIPDTEKKALLLLQRNLLTRGSNTHPLNRLLFIAWAFKDWQDFASQYKATPTESLEQPLSRTNGTQDPNAKKREQAIKLLITGKSATSVSIHVGVDTQTVICWGRAAGCDIEKRPRQDKSADIALAKQLLYDGTEKLEIEAKTNLSRVTINRLLRCDTLLSQHWASKRNQHQLQQKRSQWQELQTLNPAFSTQQIRLLNNALYTWLYRNDRSWLLTQTKRTNTGNIGNNSAIKWDERDFNYAQKVKEAALRLSTTHSGRKLSLNQLVRTIPELRKKLKYLNRLPKTRDALVAALRPHVAASSLPFQFDISNSESD